MPEQRICFCARNKSQLSVLKDISNTLSHKGAAMHQTTTLLSVLVVSLSAVVPAWGQTPDRATRARGARQGAKPGEIITAPDLSERWRDQLQVGEAAPEFTLPLASGTEDAKLIAQHD